MLSCTRSNSCSSGSSQIAAAVRANPASASSRHSACLIATDDSSVPFTCLPSHKEPSVVSTAQCVQQSPAFPATMNLCKDEMQVAFNIKSQTQKSFGDV